MHGSVVDNVVSIKLVLANGRIVTAPQPDLFWALRGVGHNFGVVLGFEFRLYEQGDVWSSTLGFYGYNVPIISFPNDLSDQEDRRSPAFLALACPGPVSQSC
jgi:hypothetical protein